MKFYFSGRIELKIPQSSSLRLQCHNNYVVVHFSLLLASYPDLPTHTNIHTQFIFYHSKSGKVWLIWWCCMDVIWTYMVVVWISWIHTAHCPHSLSSPSQHFPALLKALRMFKLCPCNITISSPDLSAFRMVEINCMWMYMCTGKSGYEHSFHPPSLSFSYPCHHRIYEWKVHSHKGVHVSNRAFSPLLTPSIALWLTFFLPAGYAVLLVPATTAVHWCMCRVGRPCSLW